MYGHAIDFSNFLRVDDEGVEHSVTFVDKSKNGEEIIAKDDVPVEMASEAKRATVDKMIEYYEGLPQHALLAPATGYDLKAIYVLLKMLHS